MTLRFWRESSWRALEATARGSFNENSNLHSQLKRSSRLSEALEHFIDSLHAR